jgi:hypothetical protein
MNIFHEVAQAIQSIFSEETDELAKKTGFIKRQRKLTGSLFIKTLLFGWMQNKPASVEALVRAGFTHKLYISGQGLTKRFTEESAYFVSRVLENALRRVIKSTAVDIEVIKRFSAIYIADCSKIALPNELKNIWRDTGGKASKAGVKIDASLELKTGELQFGLLTGKHCDSKTPIAEQAYEKGVLHLRDLGYFSLKRLKAQNERGEYWLSRLQPRTKVFTESGQPIDLTYYLKNNSQYSNQFELNVTVGTQEHVKARLIVYKLNQEAASRHRARLIENAKKKGRKPRQESLTLCDWNLFITNVEKNKLSLQESLMLYRVRWQIELLFKLWKTHCQLADSLSENPYRILCELYIKLLIVLIQHWIILTGLWVIPERSLVKGVQMIREQSAHLAYVINDNEQLILTLQDIAQRFLIGCSINKRKAKLNTVDLMINCKSLS